ncbi:MAG: tetratricopeptide repeat protein [Planctomycetota bacterium]|nr:tetratricopeptide repeat protein [Planctomycetota bacterium]
MSTDMPPSSPPSRLEQIQAMLVRSPGDPFLLYALAQEQAKAGNHAQAVLAYDRCLAADPTYYYAYYHKARSQEELGDAAGLIATLDAGIAASRGKDAKAHAELLAYRDMV